MVQEQTRDINKWFKNWGIICHIYLHKIHNNGYIFWDIAIIPHMDINSGENIFYYGHQNPNYNGY